MLDSVPAPSSLGAELCAAESNCHRGYPQDKTPNAHGLRRAIEDLPPWTVDAPPDTPIPPLLARLLDAQAGTGLPPAYLPKHNDRDEGETT